MSIQIIIGSLLLGMISSFHCIGMCGPLVLALPVKHLPVLQRTGALLLYHTGRIGVYTSFGLLFGLLGRRIYLAGLQQWLSIVLGIVILVILIQYYLYRKVARPTLLRPLYQWMEKCTLQLWKAPSLHSFFLLGAINGLLPCGMVYLALAMALSTSHVGYGVLLMMLYGIGTLPVLMGLSLLGTHISIGIRSKIRKAMPYVMAMMAVCLILRGLNLGIPFVSPVLSAPPGQVVECH